MSRLETLKAQLEQEQQQRSQLEEQIGRMKLATMPKSH
jgi:hypothetical protein